MAVPQTAKAQAQKAVAHWQSIGLTEQQTNDLLLLTERLADVTNQPFATALKTIEGKVLEEQEAMLLTHVEDVIRFGQITRGR